MRELSSKEILDCIDLIRDSLNKFNKAFTDLGVGNNLFNVKVTPVTK